MLAHHEDLRGALRQHPQAAFERGKKLLLPERAFRLLPGVGRFLPVAAAVEQGVELARVAFGFQVRNWPFPALTPDRVYDLVLEDAGEPGAQVGAADEIGFPRQRGEQGILDGVLRRGRVPQLQRGEAQQVRPQAFDLGTEILRCGGGGQGLETGSWGPF